MSALGWEDQRASKRPFHQVQFVISAILSAGRGRP